MNNANLLKGTAIVLILIVALVVFDSYSGNSSSKITAYAVSGTESAGALSIDLANYPAPFMENGQFNGVIVVGDYASPETIFASIDVANGLFGSNIPTGTTKLASEVYDPFAQNVISVGVGCSNAVTSDIQTKFGQISGRQCWNGALTGEGMGAITLYDFGNGKVGLVVEGYADEDVRRAAKVLMSYKDWKAAGQLQGTGILVEKLTSEGGTKLSGYTWAPATGQACPSTITVTSNKQTAYSQGETAVFTITMLDSGGGIVKRGASLSISSATENPEFVFSLQAAGTESGVITVEVPLTASAYPPGGYAVQVRSDNGNKAGDDCSSVEGGQSFAVQVATAQTATSADCSKGEKAVIRGGDKKTYSVAGKEYEVEAKSVSSMSAQLVVNGETVKEEGGLFLVHPIGDFGLADGATLRTFNTVVDTQPYGMQFCLQKAADETAKGTVVALGNGWNMIAVPTFTHMIDTDCRKDDGSASTGLYDVVQIWNYSDTTTLGYDKFRLSDNLITLTWITDLPVDGPRKTSAGWVYNYGPSCSIISAMPSSVGKESFTGWAQLAVQPSWNGKAVSELLQPDCNFGGGWFYDNQPSGANWERIELNTKFEQKHIGKGFWAHSSKGCTIG